MEDFTRLEECVVQVGDVNITAKYQLGDNIRSTKLIVHILIAHYASILLPNGALILSRTDVAAEFIKNDPVSTQTIHETTAILYHVFALLFVYLCCRHNATASRLLAKFLSKSGRICCFLCTSLKVRPFIHTIKQLEKNIILTN